jgi:hypothetical protein
MIIITKIFAEFFVAMENLTSEQCKLLFGVFKLILKLLTKKHYQVEVKLARWLSLIGEEVIGEELFMELKD